MKKYYLIALLSLFARGMCDCDPIPSIGPSVEVKAGYFFFADSTMNKIYKHGGIDGQISGFYPIYFWEDQDIAIGVYGSAEYLRCSGKSLGGGESTYIWEIPVSLGLYPMSIPQKHLQRNA